MRQLCRSLIALVLILSHVTTALAQESPFGKLPPSTFSSATPASPIRPTPLAPPLDPATNEEMCIMAAPEKAPITSYERKVEDYLAAYYSDIRLERVYYASLLREEIFSHVGTDEYVIQLQYLDDLHNAYPEAIYDIAKSLQMHWEARYTRGLGQLKLEKFAESDRNGLRNGVTVGVAAKGAALAILGATMFFKPQAAPKYFRLYRHLSTLAEWSPALGTAAGVAHGLHVTRNGMLTENLPASPAHLMTFGLPFDEYDVDYNELVNEASTFASSLIVGTAIYKIGTSTRGVQAIRGLLASFKWLNRLATPAKINAYVLIASVVISYIVEESAEAAIESWQFDDLKNQLLSSRDLIVQGMDANDPVTLFTGADSLIKSTTQIVSHLDAPIRKATLDYALEVAEVEEEYKDDLLSQEAQIRQLTERFHDEIVEIARYRKANQPDPDQEALTVLSYMIQHDVESIKEMGHSAMTRAKQYQRAFGPYRASLEKARGRALTSDEQVSAFNNYLWQVRYAKEDELAADFKAGNIPAHGSRIILQSASLLRFTDNLYVTEHADFLMSLVSRNEMLFEGARLESSTRLVIVIDPYAPDGGLSEMNSNKDPVPGEYPVEYNDAGVP